MIKFALASNAPRLAWLRRPSVNSSPLVQPLDHETFEKLTFATYYSRWIDRTSQSFLCDENIYDTLNSFIEFELSNVYNLKICFVDTWNDDFRVASEKIFVMLVLLEMIDEKIKDSKQFSFSKKKHTLHICTF